jgi:hypothetical protein
MKNKIVGFEICTLGSEAFSGSRGPHKSITVYKYTPDPLVREDGVVTNYYATVKSTYFKPTRSSCNRVLRAMLKVGQIA